MPKYEKKPIAATPTQRPAAVTPLAAPLPGNARLAAGSSWMHDDGNASDASVWPGPWGPAPTVTYFKNTASGLQEKGGMCPGFGFDSQGRVYTTSFGFGFGKLLCLDAGLAVVAKHDVPRRPDVVQNVIRNTLRTGSVARALKQLFRDTSGGAYFVIDDQDRVILPTSKQTFWVLELDATAPDGFSLVECFDVFGAARTRGQEGTLPPDRWRDQATEKQRRRRPHRMVGTMPVAGPAGERRYWFTTNRGIVGVISRTPSCATAWIDLNDPTHNAPNRPREEIQNSFAAGENGAFVVSNHALYRFTFDGQKITLEWRTEYCRLDCPTHPGACPWGVASHTAASGKAWAKKPPKPGQIDRGSGTTPTLVGDRFVAIADGAPHLGLLLLDQKTGAHVGRVEVFGGEESACENSVIAHGDSLYIGNSWGYTTPFAKPKSRSASTFGMERVDIVPAAQAHPTTGRLRRRWQSFENVGSAPPKLSTGSGLLYAYGLARGGGRYRWSLFAFDPQNGAVSYKLPLFEDAGQVKDHDNAWATMSTGPDGALFLGMWRGFLHVKD